MEEVRKFVDAYEATIRACIAKLAHVGSDCELSADELVTELAGVAAQAERCWTVAVRDSESRREAMRAQISDLLQDSAKLREQLGDDEFDTELSSMQEEVDYARVLLKQLHERAKANQQHWSTRRAERMQEYESLHAITAALKFQLGHCGQTGGTGRPDLSKANLEWMRLEQEKLLVEKERRLQQLVAKLEQLTKACAELGEDGISLAASVHPSLAPFWPHHKSKSMQATVDEVLSRPGGRLSLSGIALLPTDDPDCSDATLQGLGEKIQETATLRTERLTQADELAAILTSLWTALREPEDSPERCATTIIMRSAQRLHTRSLGMCREEVGRLESAQCQAMKDLVLSKSRELEELCLLTRISVPAGLDTLMKGLAATNSHNSTVGGKLAAGTGQVADVLSKVVRMMDEVNATSEKRTPLLLLVRELEDAREESAWVGDYNADEGRYKGRDANRNLQRSIRAGKMREKMPSLVAALGQSMQEWRITEGKPFMVNGQDYEMEVLPSMAKEVEIMVAERMLHSSRSSSSGGGGSTHKAAPKPAAPVHRGVSAPGGKPPGTASKAGGLPRGAVATIEKLSASLATPNRRLSSSVGGGPVYPADSAASVAASPARLAVASPQAGSWTRTPNIVSPMGTRKSSPLIAALVDTEMTDRTPSRSRATQLNAPSPISSKKQVEGVSTGGLQSDPAPDVATRSDQASVKVVPVSRIPRFV